MALFAKESVLKQDRIIYLDLLRVVSVIFMILIHVSGNGLNEAAVSSFTWNVSNICDAVSRFCVPVFVMISGSSFLDPEKDYSLKKIYKVKLLHIVTAFLFWSAIYAAWTTAANIKESPVESLGIMLLNLIVGPFHLWFLFMIAGLYMLTPVLRKISADKKLTEYFMVLSFVFAFVLVFFRDISEKLPLTNMYIKFVFTVLDNVTHNFHLEFLLGYIFYFLAGYYLKEFGISKKLSRLIYIAGVLMVVGTAALTYLWSVKKGENEIILYNYLYFPVCITAMAIYLFFRNEISKISFSPRMQGVIVCLSRYSFGIYLVHILVKNLLLSSLGITVTMCNGLLSVPLITILTFLISLIIVAIIGRIPVLKKYVI